MCKRLIKLSAFLVLLIFIIFSKSVFADYVFFTAEEFECVTDYVWTNGEIDRNVPSEFSAPAISLTNTPDKAVLRMKNMGSSGETMLFNARNYIDTKKYGKGISYYSDNSSNFLDIYANGKVVFGIVSENRLSPTIKMYCSKVRSIPGYWD